MKKAELRDRELKKRLKLPPHALETASRSIAKRFFENLSLFSVKHIHTFIRIPRFNEVDTSMIYFQIWRNFADIRTSAPRLNFVTGHIESVEFVDLAELVENDWGIREPAGNIIAPADEIDVVIVPLLGFDERGYRVGYGKGFYDRFLVDCRSDCVKVGLSCFPPVREIEDTGSHDVPLDLCITPETIYRWGTADAREGLTCLAP